jgi:putative nucleotidyltransferase with HDIG domain
MHRPSRLASPNKHMEGENTSRAPHRWRGRRRRPRRGGAVVPWRAAAPRPHCSAPLCPARAAASLLASARGEGRTGTHGREALTDSPRRHPFPIVLPSAAQRVIARLRAAGHEAYAVGGAVRDALLGKAVEEVDVTTSAAPDQVMGLFHHCFSTGYEFGVVGVIEGGLTVEVATFREDMPYLDGRHPSAVRFADVATDARRRDFTVNGLYYDPMSQEVLDFTSGLDDLRKGLLRAIGEPRERFEEDRLRLLRCARFAAQLGFCIEARTWEALVTLAPRIDAVSAERVRAELDKLLTGPRPGVGMRVLLYSGLLTALLPEVEAMVGVEQPPEFHPEGDVFVHTCLVLEALQRRDSVLAWAALLHDVGKPPTFRVAERIRFDGHVGEGMRMAEAILTRLRHDRHTIERVVELVHLHLKFADLREMRPSTLKRFLRLPHFADQLELHRADCLGSHGQLDLYEFCRARLCELKEEQLRPRPLLTGHDLIALGYPPGPLFAEILDVVEEQQLDGALSTRDQAIDWVVQRWPLSGGSALA